MQLVLFFHLKAAMVRLEKKKIRAYQKCCRIYDNVQIIVRLFDTLPNFTLTTNETGHVYYY